MPIPAPPTTIITLADAKTHLNITSTTSDSELQGFIDAASALVESYVGPVMERVITDEVHDGNRSAIVLYQAPVLSVQSVTEYQGPIPFPLTSEPPGTSTPDAYGYTVDLEAGILRRMSAGFVTRWPTGTNTVKVTYTVGRTVVPPAIRLAVLELTRHLWDTQRGSSSLPLAGDEYNDQATVSYAIPNRVLELLQAHRKAPGIA